MDTNTSHSSVESARLPKTVDSNGMKYDPAATSSRLHSEAEAQGADEINPRGDSDAEGESEAAESTF